MLAGWIVHCEVHLLTPRPAHFARCREREDRAPKYVISAHQQALKSMTMGKHWLAGNARGAASACRMTHPTMPMTFPGAPLTRLPTSISL